MIKWLIQTFNNRELALIVWVLIFFILILFNKKIRKSIGGVLNNLVSKWILISIFGMIFFVSLVILLFYHFGLWDFKLLKDSTIWTFGVAFIMLMNSQKALNEHGYFKGILLDNFKLLVVFTFIVNLYVFNLIAEILILPIMISFGILQAISKSKAELKPAKKILDYIVSILGVGYLIFAVFKILGDLDNFLKIDNLKSFLLPIVLSIIFIPFAYLYALWMLYQSFFVRLKFTIKKDKKLIRFAKWKIFWTCKFNLSKLKRVSSNMIFFDVSDRHDLII